MIADLRIVGRRYIIHDEIGHGGMGMVFRATDRLTGQDVALKQVMVERQVDLGTQLVPSSSTSYRLALAREFRTLASLRHPHIISVLDYGFEIIDNERIPFFTMELLNQPGTIVEVGLNQSRAVQINLLAPLLRALAYLHRRGILHRDLKPQNVLVTGTPSAPIVKVVDFGLAFAPGQTEEFVGTLWYAAPEVLMEQPVSEAADLYAVGVMLYEMLSGKHPFGGHGQDLVMSILNHTPSFDLPDVEPVLIKVLARLLEKNPEQRYSSADAVLNALTAATGIQPPAESAAIRESFLQASRFIGREEEITELNDALFALRDAPHKGGMWLVGGESGVGKSRLLDELRARALVDDIAVVRGLASAEGGEPYQVWREVIRWLALGEITAHEASVLKPLVPDIATIVGDSVKEAEAIDPRGAQTRLFGVLTAILRRRPAPLVILLEDLHSADDESLALLLWLIREALPLLTIGTYRDDEAPHLPERLPDARRMKLNCLPDSAVAELSQLMLGSKAMRPGVITYLQRETEGNVFFLIEAARALARGERIDVVGEKMQQIIARRLEHVPPAYRPLLRLAAVMGRALDLPVLRAAAPEIDFDMWLSDLANVAVLAVDEERWQFAHDKLRIHILTHLDKDERRRLHSQAAEAIESILETGRVDSADMAAALFYHWMAASETTRAARYALLAALAALRSGAYSRAQPFLEQALEHTPAADSAQRIAVLLELGETLYGLGNYTRARELLKDCAALAEAEQRLGALAKANNLLGNIAMAFGEHDHARELLRASEQVARSIGNESEVGKAIRSLGVIAESLGNLSEAKRLYAEALEILTRAGNDLGTAAAYSNLASIARLEEDYSKARQLYEAGLTRFEAIDFQWGIAYTLTNLGLVLSALGEHHRAVERHQRGLAICREIGHRWGIGFTLANLGEAYFEGGQYDECHSTLAAALGIALELGTVPLGLQILTTLARLLAAEGCTSEAAELLAMVLAHPLLEDEVSAKAQEYFTELQQQVNAQTFAEARARGESHVDAEGYETVAANFSQREKLC